jgi:hypothetical protein
MAETEVSLFPPGGVDTGWFGSKLAKKVASGAKGAVKVATTVTGARAAVNIGKAAVTGQNVIKATVQQAQAIKATAVQMAPIAASVSAMIPGGGTALAAGIGGLSAAVQGKSLVDAIKAGALSALPGGALAQVAASGGISMGQAIIHGSSLKDIIKSAGQGAISQAISQLPPGAQQAAQVIRDVAAGKSVTASAEAIAKAELAKAIPHLPPAVQSALTGVAQVTSTTRQAMNLSRSVVSAVTAVRPTALRPTALRPLATSRALSQANVQVRSAMVSKRAHSPQGKAWLRSHSGRMASEVSGLNANGTYTVEVGDTGSSIAKHFTGNANNWKLLANKHLNPKQMNRTHVLQADGTYINAVAKYGFPVYKGDIINLPSGWLKAAPAPMPIPVQPAPVPSPLPGKPPAPTPPPAPNTLPTLPAVPAGDLVAQGEARAMLAAWGATDGRASAAISDYGAYSELSAITWTARDQSQAASFERAQGLSDKSGAWSQALYDTLHSWTEHKASAPTQPVPVPTPQPTQPLPAPIMGSDPMSLPPVPVPTPQPTQPTQSTQPTAKTLEASAFPGGTTGKVLVGLGVAGALGYALLGPKRGAGHRRAKRSRRRK